MRFRLRTLLVGILLLPVVALACCGAAWLVSGDSRLAMFAGGVATLIGTIVLAAMAMTPEKERP
jgi:hypothetical protein